MVPREANTAAPRRDGSVNVELRFRVITDSSTLPWESGIVTLKMDGSGTKGSGAHGRLTRALASDAVFVRVDSFAKIGYTPIFCSKAIAVP